MEESREEREALLDLAWEHGRVGRDWSTRLKFGCCPDGSLYLIMLAGGSGGSRNSTLWSPVMSLLSPQNARIVKAGCPGLKI
jgi:hypothetical protein